MSKVIIRQNLINYLNTHTYLRLHQNLIIATVLSTSSSWFASQSGPFEVWYHDQVSLRDLYFLISSRKELHFLTQLCLVILAEWNIRTKSDYPEYRNNVMKCNFFYLYWTAVMASTLLFKFVITNMVTKGKILLPDPQQQGI
jgi:hypothetical protein